MSHRPFSTWVVPVRLSVGDSARWEPPQDVNYGDERADARALPAFAAGWHRRAIALDIGYRSLGLVREAPDEAVIEVDDLVRPVRVTDRGAQLISRMEDDWPDAPVSADDLAVLADEEVEVRYLVVARLAAEGHPPPALFHILPWDLVDRLADQVTAMLRGVAPLQVIALRHWFTPVGSRFTAALEQLDEGLREQDAAIIRIAATALCGRLLEVDPSRLPPSTRQALAGLVTALRPADGFLAFTAARAAARLTRDGDAGKAAREPRVLRLGTRLPSAADSEEEIRTQSRDALREPFTVRLTVTATGRAEITVSARLPEDQLPWVTRAYGLILVPVKVAAADGSTRYLLPLGYSDGEVSGRLNLAVPPGDFVEADLDGPPIGAAEASLLNVTEVERSIRALRTRSAREMWSQLATLLPRAHPLRAVIAREAG
jgi:hypothetical protein